VPVPDGNPKKKETKSEYKQGFWQYERDQKKARGKIRLLSSMRRRDPIAEPEINREIKTHA
jgi:hypothetical protein